MSRSRAEYLKYKEVCKKIDDKINTKFKDIKELTLDEMVEYEKYLVKMYKYSKRCYKLREEYMNTYIDKNDIDAGHLKRVEIIKTYNSSVNSVLGKLRYFKKQLEEDIFEQYKNMTISSDDSPDDSSSEMSDDLNISEELPSKILDEPSVDEVTDDLSIEHKNKNSDDSDVAFLDSVFQIERRKYIDELKEYISDVLLKMKIARPQFEELLDDIIEWVSLGLCHCKLDECKLVELNEVKNDLYNRPVVDVFTVFIYVKKMAKIRLGGGIPLIVEYYDPTTFTKKLLTEQIMSFTYQEYPLISDLMKKLEPLVFDAEYNYTDGKRKLSRKGLIVALTTNGGKLIERTSKSSEYISNTSNRITVRPVKTEAYDSFIFMQNMK